MSEAVKSISSILSSLNIYNLGGGGLTDGELAAYDYGFKHVEKRINQLKAGAFVRHAETEMLGKYGECVGFYPHGNGDIEKQRDLIAHRFESPSWGASIGGIQKSLLACGIKGHIIEFKKGEQITVIVESLVDPTLSMDQVHYYLEKYMPAHLELQLDYGNLTFNQLDSLDKTWQQLEDYNFTWDEFDHYEN